MPKNAQTTTQLHSSHMLEKQCLKFSKPGFNKYMNHELPDIQAGFRKGRRTKDQIANICWIIEKAKEFQKNICFIDYTKAFDCMDHNKLENSSRDRNTRVPYLPPLNLYAGQEEIVGNEYGTTNWFQIRKWVHQGSLVSPCLFNLHAEYIMWNTGLDEAQAGIKIAGRIINNLRYADDTTLMAESEKELKSLLMKVKVDSEKVGLKLHIQKTKIMAPGPITSWQIGGGIMETVTDFIFLQSKITANGDCGHEIKRRLLLGWKAMTNLDSILKSRDITLPTNKGLSSQSYGFSSNHVWMWELDYKESWAPKNWCFFNCGVGEDSWESLGLQGDSTSSS